MRAMQAQVYLGQGKPALAVVGVTFSLDGALQLNILQRLRDHQRCLASLSDDVCIRHSYIWHLTSQECILLHCVATFSQSHSGRVPLAYYATWSYLKAVS